MAIVDITVIVILLLFLLVGWASGFINSILALVGWLVSLIIAIVLAPPFINMLSNMFNLDTAIGGAIESWLAGMNEGFNIVITADNKSSVLIDMISGLGVSDDMASGFVSVITMVIPLQEGQTIAQYLAPIATNVIMFIIATTILFIIFRIIIWIISTIFEKMFDKFKTLKKIDKILGLFIGFIEGAIIILLLNVIYYLLKDMAFMQEVNAYFADSVYMKTIGNGIMEFLDNNFSFEDIFNYLFNLIKGGSAAA